MWVLMGMGEGVNGCGRGWMWMSVDVGVDGCECGWVCGVFIQRIPELHFQRVSTSS